MLPRGTKALAVAPVLLALLAIGTSRAAPPAAYRVIVNSVNTTFSTTASNAFMRPTAVLQGRLFKVGAQLDF